MKFRQVAFPFVRYYFQTLKNRNPLISQGIEALILFIWLQSQDYSMIVATLPEPTVRPPSRYLNSVFCSIFYTFYF